MWNMMCLDVYLSSLSKEEYEMVNKNIIRTNRPVAPLLCWEFYYPEYRRMLKKASTNLDIQSLTEYSLTHNWNTNLEEILNKFPYEALVLTNASKKILWVNNGFTEMTGYSKSQTINRSPSFLQGENTSEEVKKRIREKIQNEEPFIEEIINYRKNGSEYNCEVRIFPLSGNNSMHFLALEREIA